MVLTINQETFDEAVQESIAEFGMSQEEAVTDAVLQFEAQGVNLSNIIKDLSLSKPGDSHIVTQAVVELEKLAKSNEVQIELFREQLSVIKAECEKGIEYRVLAGKTGGYNVILDILEKCNSNLDLMSDGLKTLISLMTKQPDLLDAKGIKLIKKYLNEVTEVEIKKLTLKWTKECCIMHEMNRQELFNANIINPLKVILEDPNNNIVVQDVLGVLRGLVLDDDVRVEFGRAHEHARSIANDVLASIITLLSKFQKNEVIINDLMLTISALLVRNEFCKIVDDAGGLDIIKNTMVAFHDKDRIIRQGFKLLKALAGNDEVKAHIVQKQLSPVIVDALNANKNFLSTVKSGLACVAALTLRSPDNSKNMFEAGISEVIVDCMKLHCDDISVQKNGSWAVRNMVSRSRYQSDKFLSLGIEDVLRDSLKKFPTIEYDIKSALRDLGCDVNLKEEWTGKGGMITSSSKH